MGSRFERRAIVQVNLPGRLIHLTPETTARPAPDLPEVVVVGAWCPNGRAALSAANDLALALLTSEVERLGRRPLAAAIIDPRKAWHQAAVAVEGRFLNELGEHLAGLAGQDRYR